MRARVLPLALAATLVAGSAAAHVAPSEDTNNRYVKLTPMADRVRVAYTVLVGTNPGRATRKGLDQDHDGSVSEAEADTWANAFAEAVRKRITVQLDGEAVPLTWSEVAVGIGDPSVQGGAFSIDLIAWQCTPGAGPRHELVLTDRFELKPEGETEIKIADEPGVRIEVARIGAAEMAGHAARFDALAAPFADGIHLTWDATRAQPLADGRCPREPKRGKATSRWPFLVAGATLVAVLMGIALGLRRRRRRSG